jgi:hypothetical protein
MAKNSEISKDDEEIFDNDTRSNDHGLIII